MTDANFKQLITWKASSMTRYLFTVLTLLLTWSVRVRAAGESEVDQSRFWLQNISSYDFREVIRYAA